MLFKQIYSCLVVIEVNSSQLMSSYSDARYLPGKTHKFSSLSVVKLLFEKAAVNKCDCKKVFSGPFSEQ